MNRLKQFFENIAYAGLKPQGGKTVQSSGAAALTAPKPKGLAAIAAWLDRKLNAAGPTDPLYLSNRTPSQRMKVWLVMGLPVVLVLGGVVLAVTGFFGKDAAVAPPPQGLTNAQLAEKMLPDLNKDLHIESQHDVDIEDVHVVDGNPHHLVGIAVNKTDHVISKAELVFDLTDRIGSRQGAVTTEVKNIPANSSTPFQVALEQTHASFALVREVHVQ